MPREEFQDKRNSLVADRVIKNLEKRHMQGFYAKDKKEALELALSLIPEGSSVGWGGSFSVEEIGLKDALKNGSYTCIDRDTAKDPKERDELMKQCLFADCFIMSTNAISEDGQPVLFPLIGKPGCIQVSDRFFFCKKVFINTVSELIQIRSVGVYARPA